MSTLALHIASECNLNPTIFAVALACAGEAALRAWHIGARGPDPRARKEHGRLTLLLVNAALALRASEPRATSHPRQCYCGNTSCIQRRPPNGPANELQSGFTQRRRPRHAACSILQTDLRAACRQSSMVCPSRPLGRRANKRRFGSSFG